LEIKTEIKKEYRNLDSWFSQFSNLISSFLWFFGVWFSTTAAIFFTGVVLIFITYTGKEPSFSDAQIFLRQLLQGSGAVSVWIAILFGLKKLRNIFLERATQRVERYEKIKNKVSSEIETTNSLLLQYGVITKNDIDKLKQDKE